MSTENQNMTNDNQVQDNNLDGLKLGQFRVKLYNNKVNEGESNYHEHVVGLLSQEELAYDWRTVLPSRNKDSPVHHFSVYLSQLPPYLWSKLRQRVDKDGNKQYRLIKDNIYNYSVRHSNNDRTCMSLFEEMNKLSQYRNYKYMEELYKELEEERVKGWLMIRARNMLKSLE
jgi:hypothetical protein